MQPGSAAYRPKPPSQGTAETLILVGFVLQVIFSLVYIVIGTLIVFAGTFFLFAGVIGGTLLLLAVILVIVPILMLYVTFHYCYQRVRDGDLSGARGPTIAMGIIGIFLGGIIVGILYIIAYVEIGSAENELRAMGIGPGGTGSYGGPYSQPYGAPYGYGLQSSGPGGVVYAHPSSGPGAATYAHPSTPGPAAPSNCPRCGRPATFIPQYGRSYCYSCAQYV